MTKHNQKVRDVEFSVVTDLTSEEIIEAGRHAMSAVRQIMNSTPIREHSSQEDAVTYRISGPGGIVTQLVFTVAWTEVASSKRRVRLDVIEYLTAQITTAFIPTGPKRVPALAPLRRFKDSLLSELAGRPMDTRLSGPAGYLIIQDESNRVGNLAAMAPATESKEARARARALLLQYP